MSDHRQLERPEAAPAAMLKGPHLDPTFVARWLDCLETSLGHEVEFPFARVRTFTGTVHRVCVPLLPYAHLDASDATALAGQSSDTRCAHVRHLAPFHADCPLGTPVTSTIPLFAWRDAAHFWENAIASALRKKIRKARKDGYSVERTSDPAAAEGFYTLFCTTMHRHGTPPYPLALFQHALAEGMGEVVNVRRGDVMLVSYVVLGDAGVTLFMWAGFNEAEDAGYASLLGEWEAIRGAFERGCRWFDLGRAPLGGTAWMHKQYWRPTLFHATCTPAPATSVYARYAFASRVWRRMPSGLARAFGPWIVRHLPDA